MSELTKEQAIQMFESSWWVGKSPRVVCMFQLFEKRLCMPFDKFHEAVEEALGRSVWTHEFGLSWERLQKEFLGEVSAPTMLEIIELIPESKRIIVVAGTHPTDASPAAGVSGAERSGKS